MKKRALLIGGEEEAWALAESLTKKNFDVTIINEDYNTCLELAELDKATIIHGDGSSPYILDDANASGADLAIALTVNDDANLVICQLCKKKFKVKRTAALINDPQKVDFFYKMGVDVVVCSVTTVTRVIEQQALMDEISSIASIGDGLASVSQIHVTSRSPAVGKKILELSLPEETIIGCILRNDHHIVPRGNTEIYAGDRLILISSEKHELAAMKELTGK